MEDADLIREALRRDERVLATITQVDGHAYRKAGAMMLLKSDGGRSGTLSPGCLEADLMAHAQGVLQEGLPRLVAYDMRPEEDLSWGEQIGCGGRMEVLLEPVKGALRTALRQAGASLDAGYPVWLLRELDEAGLPASYSILYAREAAEALCRKDTWQLRLEPKPRLLLFGAGDDAIPLSQLAQQAGFSVTITDFREALCREERFPGAKLVTGFPQETVPRLRPASGDYVVVMSHQLQRDRQFLELVAPSKPRYIGVMGSAARKSRLLGDLVKPAAVTCPVGMPIGADGPFEIAISIVAQLIQARRGGDRDEAERDRSHLFGSGEQPAHGLSQAIG
ncbi:XdhC family protein [Paenibacillus sp. PL2-23]|uniref:XdhC family protein n=1 Tax=Paenibacillus sp. PL2-23 TaxID=2100729 RepID=UPI0030FA1336